MFDQYVEIQTPPEMRAFEIYEGLWMLRRSVDVKLKR